MPELPEVEVVRRGLDAHVVGRTITGVDVLHPRPLRRHLAGPTDFAASVTGRMSVSARGSRTFSDSAYVPISRLRLIISPLSKPASGRRTGVWALGSMAARLASVCDETWPTDSPVTMACAPLSRAIRSATRYMRRLRTTCQ